MLNTIYELINRVVGKPDKKLINVSDRRSSLSLGHAHAIALVLM